MFNLAEEYLLLMISQSTLDPGWRHLVTRGVLGASIRELALDGYLEYRNSCYYPAQDQTRPDDPTLALVWQIIKCTEGDYTLAQWENLLFTKQIPVTDQVVKCLVERNVLKAERGKWLAWFLPSNRYHLVDPMVATWIRYRLRCVALSFDPPDARSLILLSILKDMRHLNLIFENDEITDALHQISRYERTIDLYRPDIQEISERYLKG